MIIKTIVRNAILCLINKNNLYVINPKFICNTGKHGLVINFLLLFKDGCKYYKLKFCNMHVSVFIKIYFIPRRDL